MSASSVVLSVGQSWHTQSQLLAVMRNILASGIGKLQSPAQKCELKSSCAGFVYRKPYLQNCHKRADRAADLGGPPFEERQEGNTNTSVQCTKKHFVQLPLKVELASLIVSLW